ncbi:hypothetical protein AB4453_23915 [Vibrio atlanticus]|uniref:hypothetical protein n=1 Tax=Vibrio atlanticus TaxID=693153 RepID=UPI00354FF57A
MAIKQTKQDLLIHLKDSCDFLEISCRAFDDGYIGEGKRLATTLRVLLHDTQSSKSLLSQLKVKTEMRYLNTAIPYDPKNLMSHHGLVGIRGCNENAEYFAFLDDSVGAVKYVKFPNWWNEIVISDSNKNQFCRRELVLSLTNKDGGAHVDPKLTDKYAALSRNNSIGWVFHNGDENTEGSGIIGIELHSVRQIAYECLESIKRKFPQLFE